MTTNRNIEDDFSNIYKTPKMEEGYIGVNKQNEYHMTEIDVAKRPKNKKEVVEEIANIHNEIPKQYIETIINAYQDLMRKEIIFNGRFKIPGILDVYSNLWNENRNRVEKIEVEDGKDIYINPPITLRPKVKINKHLKEDYKYARRYEESLNMKVNPEDWYKPFVIEKPSWFDNNKK